MPIHHTMNAGAERARIIAEAISDGLNCLSAIEHEGDIGDWKSALSNLADALDALQAREVRATIDVDPAVRGTLAERRSLSRHHLGK